MSGGPRWPRLVPLLVAVAPAGCDDNAVTAPGDAPPPEEGVVEEAESSPFLDPADLPTIYLASADGGAFVVYQGFDYPFDAFEAMLADGFDPDAARDGLDAWTRTLTLPTHEVTTWSDFDLCTDCELELTLTELVRFGEPEGAGSIESAAPRVSWNEQLGYVVTGSTFLQVFDNDGRFVRRIGQGGDGPGEFSGLIDAHVVDGRLVALDSAKRTWSIFNLAGEFIEARPYGYRAGRFTPVGGSHVVVVSMDPSPEVAGLPFHLAHIDSGVPSLHFGSGQDRDRNRANGPYSDNVTGSVASRPGTVWWGSAGSPRVEEWSTEDELLRVVDGELPWFPEVTESMDPTTDPPSTLLMSIALDGREYLWMTVRTADPGWREVELERTAEGYRVPPERRRDYMDTRLDIFDLEEQRHLGRYVWDSPYARLINLGGEPAVSIVEYTREGVRQVVVYRVEWE